MSINITPKSLDTELNELMRGVSSGKIQLPDFQRDWTWDDNRIKGILASLSQGYPMGAIMCLEYGNEKAQITEEQLKQRVESHLVKYDYFIKDDFDNYFVERAKSILKVIEQAMGKAIADKASEQTIKLYGCSLE